MKKMDVVGAHLHFYKFISMGWSNGFDGFKCGFGVDSQGEAWQHKQSVDRNCIHSTCMCVWVLGGQVKWCGNPNGMEHAKKLTLTKGYKNPINKKPPQPYLV
jgi:hypothetical protein